MEETKKRGKIVFLFLVLFAAAVLAAVFFHLRGKNAEMNLEKEKAAVAANAARATGIEDSTSFAGVLATENIPKPPPPPVNMSRLKKQGCVADGLLTEYNPDQAEYIHLINRSRCYYLHRAVETWLAPPD